MGLLKPACRPWAARHAGTSAVHTIGASMRQFAALYLQLDASTATGDKLAALRAYLQQAPAEDAAWATYFLAGGRPRRVVPTALLRRVACEMAGLDDWLFEECYQACGDLAETIAHLLPAPRRSTREGLAWWVQEQLLRWRDLDDAGRSKALREAFDQLDSNERFLLVKLIGGGFRVGVSTLLVQRALAEHAGIDVKRVAERMVGFTAASAQPTAAAWQALLAPAGQGERGAERTPSSWPTRCRPTRPPSARVKTGWWSGSTTASAPSWCGVAARCSCGLGVKS